jgi:hypothetical protein
MTSDATTTGQLPAGRELITDWPFAYGKVTTDNPWTGLLPAYCEGPDILYADAVLHAGNPAWVPRRLADLRAIYTAKDHFSSKGMAPFPALVGGACRTRGRAGTWDCHHAGRREVRAIVAHADNSRLKGTQKC